MKQNAVVLTTYESMTQNLQNTRQEFHPLACDDAYLSYDSCVHRQRELELLLDGGAVSESSLTNGLAEAQNSLSRLPVVTAAQSRFQHSN
jgi:hypothetical protein